jgi:LuxR family maltose regulon positive regulatory protein
MTAVEAGTATQSSPVRSINASALMTGSRLRVPEVTPYHLTRERLSGLLASSAAPLVLLSAPAGSGKTALAAEWAHRLDGARDVIWVSCHSGDVDPLVDVLHWLGCGEVPARWRVERAIEAAGRSVRPWTVFLDGYEVRSAGAGEELDQLLTYAGDELQVVLTTRADPVLPLHRYRLDGRLLEVRAADLAFTDGEADALLRAAGVALGSGDLHLLNTRLAGWAAGLRFALPALARHPSPEVLVASAVTYNGNINSYLVEEVLDAQPPALRDLILTTSVPDTLTPDLLEELSGEPAAPTALRLVRANMFLESPGGDDPSCLQYQPFFRDLVRSQLAYEAPERCRDLNRTVAAWEAARGSWEGAVRHLDRAGERPDCGAFLVDHLLVGRLLCERRGDPFRRLAASSASGAVPGAGGHLLAAATALADGDPDRCSTQLAAARAAGVQQGRGEVTAAVLEAVLASGTSDAASAERLTSRAEEALAAHRRAVDPAADDTAAILLLARARSALRLGAVQRADRLFEAALESRTAAWSTAYRSLCLAHAAVLHARIGAVSQAIDEAEEALAAAYAGVAASEVVCTTAHLGRAYAALMADDPVHARAHLAESTTTPSETLWQVVRALVTASLDRSAGSVGQTAARLEAAVGAATLTGPWPADWVQEESAAVDATRWQPEDVVPRAGVSVLPHQRQTVPRVTGWDGRVVEPLTPREVEVLVAVSEWLTTEEIAAKLFVSVNTVRTHVRSILSKLGVTRRNAAIREAHRLGLLTSEAPTTAARDLVGPT